MTGTPASSIERLNAALAGRYAIEQELGEGGKRGDQAAAAHDPHTLIRNWFAELQQTIGGAG